MALAAAEERILAARSAVIMAMRPFPPHLTRVGVPAV